MAYIERLLRCAKLIENSTTTNQIKNFKWYMATPLKYLHMMAGSKNLLFSN